MTAPFQELIEQAPDGVVILERGVIAFINRTAARLLGSSVDEALGRPIASFLPPADAAAAGERIARMLATGQETTPNEYRVLADSSRVVEIKSRPWRWDGRPVVLAFARDVTERKQMHDALVRADRLAALGTLAAGVAHEINNPLTYMQLALCKLELDLEPDGGSGVPRDRILACLADARHGIERITAITRSLHGFSRVDDTSLGPVELHAVVDRAVAMVENDIRHRAVLERAIADVPPVVANASRLEQVLVNLLLNAIQALRGTPDDAIRVGVTEVDAEHVAIVVQDNGCGISKAARERVFEPYFTTKPVGQGLGLGLAITKDLVESFGGRIALESTEGVGTTVTLTLRSQAGAPRVAPPTRSTGSARRRVLVVDDEPLVRDLLGEMLSIHHDVEIVDGGVAALAAMGASVFDVVVCDVMMPGFSGVDLHRAIAARSPGAEARIIFVSGGAFIAEIADAVLATGRPVLAKPFDIEALLAHIDAVGAAAP